MNYPMKNPQIEEHRGRYDLFPVGQFVKVICNFQDFYFFSGDTGVVIRNSGKYLGIIVKFDKPRHFESGYIQTEFNFDPQDLIIY